MTKIALPALVLIIFGLFFFSVTSPPDEAPDIAAAPSAEPIQQRADTAEVKQEREQPPAKAVEAIRAEPKQVPDDAKANGDKIAQAVAPRPDPQESKPSSDKPEQPLADQINALRAEQVQLQKDAREASDKAAQALRQEAAASQARLADQIGDTLKANGARIEALAQRVDALKQDIDGVKKGLEEDRQNASNISPGLALVMALAALVLGPLVARQFTANQLAAARKDEAAAAAQRAAAAKAAAAKTSAPKTSAATTPPAGTGEADPPLAPPTAAEPPREAVLHHEAPKLGEESSPPRDEARQQAAPDSEKV